MSLPVNSLYSLTWGDYGTSLVSAIQLLRCHGDLVDCTLAAGGRSFPAHKIVLCAASPFLLDLLKTTSCKHPVVMLAGVAASDLEALLEFVYRGEVSVDHSQLPSLLHAAQCLNIQGLAPQNVSHKDEYTSIQIHPSMTTHHVKGIIDSEELLSQLQNSEEQQEVHEIIEEITPDPIPMQPVIIKDINHYLPTRKRKRRTKKIVNVKQSKILNDQVEEAMSKKENDLQEQQQLQQQQEETIEVKMEKVEENLLKIKTKSQSEQPAACKICGAIIRQSRNLRRHLELRHFSKQGRKSRKGGKTVDTKVNVNETMDGAATSMDTVTVTIESQNEQQQSTMEQLQQQQQQHEEQHQLVTQHENTDGTTSLTIAHVQTMQGHQIIGSLNQATILRTDDQMETGIIATHEPTLRPQTELFRVGTVYTIEERQE